MGERSDLLDSVVSTIQTYREGEIPKPTSDHVDRWLSQFTAENQLPFLREFDHVIKKTFLTKDTVTTFLGNLVKNPKLVGNDPANFWAKATLLCIQRAGQSQKEMVSIFGDALEVQCGLDFAKCGATDGDYIYLDDVLFTGGRVATDLEDWIANKAPQTTKVHVLLMAFHTSGHYWITNKRLKQAVAKSGKEIEIKFWYQLKLENQRNRKDESDVLWPASIPNDPATQAYLASLTRFPLVPRTPGGAVGMFSSEAGRQLLEHEFLIAGVKIRSLTQAPKDFIRPLGCGGFGVGFGAMLVTYRNCPNNCPLAMWWGDPEATSGALHWYPLLSRKTYSAPENVFNVFDDLTI